MQLRLSEPIRISDCQSKLLSNSWTNPIQLGELFCGAGGMALGASQAVHNDWRFEHVWATDINKDSCRTIEQIVPPEKIYNKDIQNINFQAMMPIDGLVFGFPCNDFSAVGKRRGIDGEYGELYKFGVKALNALNPKFFVAENVSGLSSVNQKNDFGQILDELREASVGYDVVTKLYKFEEYGIPQKRHRYIIVGFRSDTEVKFYHSMPTYKTKTAAQALDGLCKYAHNNERAAQSRKVIDRLNHIKPGENVFTANLPPELELKMRSGATISQTYRRLRADEPSYTVTGSGGGGSHVYHWDEPRALTNRERARLQTFPDWYKFEGGKESVRKQIGMAVPPEGAKIIFQSVLDTIIRMI